jgi:hypothetical protein
MRSEAGFVDNNIVLSMEFKNEQHLHVMTLVDPAFLYHTTHDDDPSTPWDPSKLERVSAIPGTVP